MKWFIFAVIILLFVILTACTEKGVITVDSSCTIGAPTNYDNCVKFGGVIQEGSPRTCSACDRNFSEEIASDKDVPATGCPGRENPTSWYIISFSDYQECFRLDYGPKCAPESPQYIELQNVCSRTIIINGFDKKEHVIKESMSYTIPSEELPQQINASWELKIYFEDSPKDPFVLRGKNYAIKEYREIFSSSVDYCHIDQGLEYGTESYFSCLNEQNGLQITNN